MFFATTNVYVDRQVFGILGPQLTEEFGWSEKDFSFIVSEFTLAYAIGYSLAGRMMDVIGERKGFFVVFGVWSVAEIAHGLVGPLVYDGLPWLNAVFAGTFLGGLTPAIISVAGFSVVRFSLGLVEGGHFPGASRRWGSGIPRANGRCRRAFSTAAAMSAPSSPSGPSLHCHHNAMGLGGRILYDRDFEPSVARILEILLLPARDPSRDFSRGTGPHSQRSGRSSGKDPLAEPSEISTGLGLRVGHDFDIARMVVLHQLDIQVSQKQSRNRCSEEWLAADCDFPDADVGSIAGGALSSWLIKLGATLNVARKTAFLLCAFCALPVMLVARVTGLWPAVLLIGLAAAAHAGFSANLYTIVSDTIPAKPSVPWSAWEARPPAWAWSVSLPCRLLLDWTNATYGEKDYLIPFVMAGSAYLIATAIIHLLLPRLEPMKFAEDGLKLASPAKP